MRKIFKERKRIAVYVEAEDEVKMINAARLAGKTLVEWAREVLIEASGNHREKDVSGYTDVHRTRRGSSASEGREESRPKGKTCAHGKPKGYHCWQCAGMAVIE